MGNKRDENQRFSHYNFFQKNHKGLSTIVVTLIIILLSLVAVGVVWVVVKNIISGGVKDIGLGKFVIDLDIIRAYEQGGNIIVNVKRNAGEGELVRIKFIFSDRENSEVITQDSNLGQLESKNFLLNLSELVSAEVVSVSVSPVFKLADETEKVGEITDTYYLNSGEGGNGTGRNETAGNGTECIPDCTGLECGTDPVCGKECGPCSGDDSCISGICVPVNCEPETPETTCGTWICGKKLNNCGAEVNCGNCSVGQMCQEGNCIEITPINTGIVEETWPGTSGMYFGSNDLPVDISYQGYYIEFPGSEETDCLLIAIYRFPVEGYAKSHIGFNFETLIGTGDDYQIWTTLEECKS